MLGLALAVLSITPSLLPRPALLQGVIAAVCFGLGYLIGSVLWMPVARRLRTSVRPRSRRIFWSVYAAAWVVAVLALAWLSLLWQNEVRRLVEMPPHHSPDLGLFALGFAPTALVLLAVGRGIRLLYRSLRPKIGGALAVLGAAAVAVSGLGAVAVLGMTAVDAVYHGLNAAPDAEVAEPGSDHRSAGPESAVAWEELGRHGSAFIGGGPTAAQIAAVTGRQALEPIRVYAGVESAPTPQDRAQLVVAELERTGAFDRAVLVLATTTGSGWLEPQTVDAIEYLHLGDTAIASMQYAYTPSWVSFLFDPDAPVASAVALYDAVVERWQRLPADDRPLLLSYGLSLGAHGSQALFDDVADLRSRVDGAMFVGSPNGSPLWRSLQASRDAGSPAWQPVLDEGRQVRWISRAGDEDRLPGAWEHPRMLYLQHATDPVTWLSADLLFGAPEWLEPGQRGADVSPAMRWMPVVTALQVGIDMLGGEAVPARHGHNFGDVVTTGWRLIAGDAGLDESAVTAIEREIASYAPIQGHTE